MPSASSLTVVAHATTGPYQVDIMDDVPNATARKRFIGIYLDFCPNLAKVRAADFHHADGQGRFEFTPLGR